MKLPKHWQWFAAGAVVFLVCLYATKKAVASTTTPKGKVLDGGTVNTDGSFTRQTEVSTITIGPATISPAKESWDEDYVNSLEDYSSGGSSHAKKVASIGVPLAIGAGVIGLVVFAS
jgi:hypothetical protein